MFGCIVVATDLQASTRVSLAAACDLLRADGEVLLVHVIRPVAGLPDTERDALHERLTAGARGRMHELAASFSRQRGTEILCLSAVGTPGRKIAEIAAHYGADLVILAHDPVDDPATLGSVSYQVARHGPCAVLVLKTPPATRLRAHPARLSAGAQQPRREAAGVVGDPGHDGPQGQHLQPASHRRFVCHRRTQRADGE